MVIPWRVKMSHSGIYRPKRWNSAFTVFLCKDRAVFGIGNHGVPLPTDQRQRELTFNQLIGIVYGVVAVVDQARNRSKTRQVDWQSFRHLHRWGGLRQAYKADAEPQFRVEYR